MRKTIVTIGTLLMVLILAACSGSSSQTLSLVSSGESAETTAQISNISSSSDATVAETLAENATVHESADTAWDEASVVAISLEGDTISVTGEGVRVDGSTATIFAAGTYRLSGTLDYGQIIVNTDSEAVVRLILNGVELANSSSAPIYIEKSKEVIIVLADGTQNTISDGRDYVLANPETDEPNATIFSAADLTISGSGALTVYVKNNDGITSKDGLVLAGGTISVQAVDDGLRGKDYLVVEDGVISVEAGGDGLKADNAEDATKGFISVEAGVLNITAGGDAITAATDVLVSGGELAITSGGGSHAWVDDYITKPFRLRELLVRMRAVLRRAAPSPTSEPELTIGDITLDSGKHEVRQQGQAVELTPLEFLVLEMLMQAAGQVVRRAELCMRLIENGYSGSEATLKIHIRNLRLKLNDDLEAPRYIETVFGIGYRFMEAAI